MNKFFCNSSDKTSICYELSGNGDTALLFVHGWLGNKSWWLNQARAFESKFLIARMDLGGHGESGKTRAHYSSKLYADDIAAVANSLQVKKVILVGHSMSGAYVLQAAPMVKNLESIIQVDTVKDVEQTMDPKFLASLFDGYRKDFRGAVLNALPMYPFAKKTPIEVRERLQSEFLKNDGDFAVKVLEPLYKMDLPPPAKAIQVPVRAINSDNSPTNLETNKKYFRDYDVRIMRGTGHYPMLEDSDTFNLHLKEFCP